MAYQVISQNNTTTTLADENGNVIRVPARVSLATSTDYTIKKVNNTTATLEDGNGNIIRDVPCVAVLVGGEGGGGGGGAVSSVNGQTGDVVITGNDVLPDQTGQSGKFLTTDGTDASWAAVNALQNTATGTNSLTIFGTPTTAVRALNIGYNCSATTNAPNATAIGYNCVADGNAALAIGTDAKATGEGSVAINGKANMPNSAARAVVIGAKVSGDKTIAIMTGYTNYYTNITASYATVLGYISNPNTIESNSFYVGVGTNANQTVKLLGSDGTIPSDRLVHAINKYSTMPTAASANEGWIVQFTGTTDSTYTHGHLYECVSDGQDPATYSWTEVSMGGGGLQNTATGTNSLTILGTAAAVANSVNIGAGSSVSIGSAVAIGGSSVASNRCTAIGYKATANNGVAIGANMRCSASGAIQIGSAVDFNPQTNSTQNTFKVANANGNFEMMSADGTIPAARHASLPAADGTYTLQLVIADGVPTLSWVAV